MKQLNSDFTNAIVGDKIYHRNGGQNTIVCIDKENPYPIEADDNNSYAFNGKLYWNDAIPSIFTHPVKLIHADDIPVDSVDQRIDQIEKEVQRLRNDLETLKEAGK